MEREEGPPRRTSREKNVLEESNCEGRRRRSVPGNRNKFLHGVVFSRGRGGNDGYTGGC